MSDLERVKEAEAENAKLETMYAELDLESAAVRDLPSREL